MIPTEQLVAAAQEVFAERLVAVLLTGSHAVGQERPGSDLNAVLVVSGLPAVHERRKLVREVERRLLWSAEVRLSAELLGEDELDATDPSFARGVRLLWGDGPEVLAFIRALSGRYAYDEELGAWTWSRPT